MIDFWFDGKSFRSVVGSDGFVLNRVGFLAPKRDIEEIVVPGRNSMLVVDNGRWNYVSGYYQCFIQSGYSSKIRKLISWLSDVGTNVAYNILEDTVDAEVYRMAKFVGITEKKVKDNDIARIDIEFSAEPELWLKSGDEVITFSSSGTLFNPTTQASKPKIVIYGSGTGTITIGYTTVEISDISNGMVIDSDMQKAYAGTVSKDADISGVYPLLYGGENPISFSGGVTSLEIVPRWWSL